MRHHRKTAALHPAPSRTGTAAVEGPVSRVHLTRPSPEVARETARYIAQLTAEMAGMAGAARLEMLAYFLDMARNEAEIMARFPAEC